MGKTFLRQASLLTGTTVGAGIFALPWAFRTVGSLVGLLLFSLALGLVLLINLSYGWIVVRTEGEHELSGYASHYLGFFGRLLSIILFSVLTWGAMLAYTHLAGSFLANLFSQPHLSFIFGLYYLLVLAALVFLGLKFLTRLDLLLIPSIIFLVTFLFFASLTRFSWVLFLPLVSASLSWREILSAFGVFLFALSGFSVIADVLHLGGEKRKGLVAVAFGSFLPALIYLIYSVGIINFSGALVSPDSLSGAASQMPGWLLTLLFILGILTTSSAFLGLGNVLKNAFERDFKVICPWSWFFTVYPPLFGFLFLQSDFLGTIAVSGLVSTVILMIIVGLMWRKVREK